MPAIPADSRQSPSSWDKAIEEFVRYLGLERGRSHNTLVAYRRDLEAFANWITQPGVTDPDSATAEHLQAYLSELSGSPRSIQRALSSIRSFYRYRQERGYSQVNPADGLTSPQASARLPKALPVDTVTRLLESVSADDPIAIRDRALLELLYGTGARVSEVVGLAVDDVQSPSGATPEMLRVIGKGDKERIVPLGSHARMALEAYLVRARPALVRRSTPALFLGVRGQPLSRQSVWLVLRQRAEAAGITAELSPHTLRHSCATHLIAGGADIRVVQELLGHQSVQTTQIYTKVTIDSLRDVYYTSHPRARA